LPATALHEVHDLRQEVFIALYQNARRYQARGLFRAYLLGIAARQARGLTRSVAIHRRLLELFWGASTRRGEPAELPAAALEARLTMSRLLSGLSAAHREVVVLFHLQGLSAADIASSLAISEKTVWTRLHRARQALQKARGEAERREAT
jgi:RNA polymerase sigma-70 factor (ECF subfamily)